MTRKRLLLASVAAALVSAAADHLGAIGAQPPARVEARILSPADGAFASGLTMIRAQVAPASAAANVVFFVDGEEVCRRSRAPFECEWDAGATIVPHHVRLVANLHGGGRVVHSVRTAGVSFAETVDVDLVQVSVTVTDGHGRYVDGLPQSAFHVFEDGRPQAISQFFATDAPVELVVALDLSSSMAPSLAEMKRAALAFLRTLPASHRLTLLGFNDEVFTLHARDADRQELEAAIDALNAWGKTALYEAIARSVDVLGSRTGRKAAVVFTDGQDQGSHLALAELERALHASDLILYLVGHGAAGEREDLRRVMSRLASPTGGRALMAQSIAALESSFNELFEEISHQYVLGYQAPPGSPAGGWHTIDVKVDGGYRVQAREGYRTRGRPTTH